MTETTTRPTDPRPRDDQGPAGDLTTADIAGGRPVEPTEREGESASRSHVSEIPDARVTPLFADDAATELKERWTDIQAGFVDEPRTAVEGADSLVAEVMQRLADSFATERQALEGQWSRGDDASTEDLRVALRRYRSFFDRLLSI